MGLFPIHKKLQESACLMQCYLQNKLVGSLADQSKINSILLFFKETYWLSVKEEDTLFKIHGNLFNLTYQFCEYPSNIGYYNSYNSDIIFYIDNSKIIRKVIVKYSNYNVLYGKVI